MIKRWLGIVVVAFGMCLAASSAHAQDMGKFTVFAGYSWTTNGVGNNNTFENICFEEPFFCGTTGLSGYTGSVVYNVSKNVGIEANFSGHNGSPTIFSCSSPGVNDCFEDDTTFKVKERQDLYTYTFGPKFTVPLGNWAIWGHVLVGAAHAHVGMTIDECTIEPPIEAVGPTSCDTFGISHTTGNGFALKTGGGLDWNHNRWGLRLVEVDFVHLAGNLTTSEDEDSGFVETSKGSANNIEVATGITFNFGRH